LLNLQSFPTKSTDGAILETLSLWTSTGNLTSLRRTALWSQSPSRHVTIQPSCDNAKRIDEPSHDTVKPMNHHHRKLVQRSRYTQYNLYTLAISTVVLSVLSVGTIGRSISYSI
jgi:hypothetical protein